MSEMGYGCSRDFFVGPKGSCADKIEHLESEVKAYRAALLAHHEMGTLSDGAIRESAGGTCQICARARRGRA